MRIDGKVVAKWLARLAGRMLKKSFAGHGPAPQKSQVIDLSLWGGAMRCQRSVGVTFQQPAKCAVSHGLHIIKNPVGQDGILQPVGNRLFFRARPETGDG